MLNQHQIIGNLGRDPEVRYAPSGSAICNFSVATTEKWKDKQTGEKKEATEWHKVTAFDGLAEICGQYLTKGMTVYISGKSITRKYVDKDGVERYSTEIRANEMKMLGGPREEGGQRSSSEGRPAPQRAAAPAPSRAPARAAAPATGTGFDDMDDDIPF